ncbi:uncharacterized protein BDV17DRAFT_251405 [Aspergillus undulatus]|uniref:uncharacterized protein n=1 Tax=Aspergillus undulatus TaxID=1810928 RepID=UPI003CCD4C90
MVPICGGRCKAERRVDGQRVDIHRSGVWGYRQGIRDTLSTVRLESQLRSGVYCG